MRKNREAKFRDDVCEVPTSKRLIRKLEKTTELRILDDQGQHVMSFWKGDKKPGERAQ